MFKLSYGKESPMKKNLWHVFFPLTIVLAYTAGWFADKNPVAAFIFSIAASGCIVGTILTR